MPRHELNDLLAFVAVARERSFTKAAAKLGVSQPAVSEVIADLERAVRHDDAKIREFDTSCFSGQYVTGDVTVEYLARLSGERIHRIEELELYAMDRAWLAEVERLLERRMKFSLTVAAQHLYLSIGTKTLSCSMERIATLHER